MIFTDKAAREKIASLESRIGELEADIITKDQAIESHNDEITAKDQAIAEHIATIGNLNDRISTLETEADASAATITASASKITELESAVTAAQASASVVATEMLASIGQPEPLAIGQPATESENHITREQFNSLDHIARNKFIAGGGKIKG
jgi:uncharacterized coiled-coil protein SlyX